jgi:hypothetical protein
VHYVNNTFCKYKNFENTTELKFNDLKVEDKKILILNTLLIIFIFITLIFIINKLYKKKNK